MGTGLLLGGGLSFLAAQHGFSVDALREADVVLVSGLKVTATRTNQYSDLLRALKGGGNRFGIVTRYVVEAIHTGTKEDKRWFGGSIMVSTFKFPGMPDTQHGHRGPSGMVRQQIRSCGLLLIMFGTSRTLTPVRIPFH